MADGSERDKSEVVLQVSVVQARLLPADLQQSLITSRVELMRGGAKHTTTRKKGSTPKWLEDFKFPLIQDQPQELQVFVYCDSPSFSSPLGSTAIDTSELSASASSSSSSTIVRWFPLSSANGHLTAEVCLVLRRLKPLPTSRGRSHSSGPSPLYSPRLLTPSSSHLPSPLAAPRHSSGWQSPAFSIPSSASVSTSTNEKASSPLINGSRGPPLSPSRRGGKSFPPSERHKPAAAAAAAAVEPPAATAAPNGASKLPSAASSAPKLADFARPRQGQRRSSLTSSSSSPAAAAAVGAAAVAAAGGGGGQGASHRRMRVGSPRRQQRAAGGGGEGVGSAGGGAHRRAAPIGLALVAAIAEEEGMVEGGGEERAERREIDVEVRSTAAAVEERAGLEAAAEMTEHAAVASAAAAVEWAERPAAAAAAAAAAAPAAAERTGQAAAEERAGEPDSLEATAVSRRQMHGSQEEQRGGVEVSEWHHGNGDDCWHETQQQQTAAQSRPFVFSPSELASAAASTNEVVCAVSLAELERLQLGEDEEEEREGKEEEKKIVLSSEPDSLSASDLPTARGGRPAKEKLRNGIASSSIRRGWGFDRIVVGLGCFIVAVVATTIVSARSKPKPKRPTYYQVKHGDTYCSIAGCYGVDAEDVIRANLDGVVADPNLIYPGDIVYIPTRKR